MESQVETSIKKEIYGKIAQAKDAIQIGKCFFANPEKVVGELDDLGLTTEDCWDCIVNCLDEITPYDYAGKRPPEFSYENKIKNKELFAFAWDSKYMGKNMYLKFVIKNECFWYVSFHESKK